MVKQVKSFLVSCRTDSSNLVRKAGLFGLADHKTNTGDYEDIYSVMFMVTPNKMEEEIT